MTAEVAIRTVGLAKHFGPVRALDGLDLEVHRGETFGFLGPNGSGKSTTIRILCDLLRPTAGTVEVFGVPPRRGGPAQRARIGYLPGELNLPRRHTAGSLLSHLCRLRPGTDRGRMETLARRFDLDLSRPIEKLSKGNKQKIGVVQAFMHQPELLILDEPTSGLDPLLQREFQSLVAEVAADGVTVFASSHVLSEIEVIADRVAIIRAGRAIDVSDVAELRHRAGQRVEATFAHRVDPEPFAALASVESLTIEPDPGGTWTLRCILRGEPDRLIKALAAHRVVAWHATERDLEHLFLDVYDGTDTGTDADPGAADRPGQVPIDA